ncbi:nucleotidyltransferase domain-containing protein [Methanocella sp. MCL-LM]|uniref:nucleotidyltransferase domain-containing protein n=1 Tax=Methanocella sp. MCL-LM TaxID=3412035 RepID=UPI003C760DF3
MSDQAQPATSAALLENVRKLNREFTLAGEPVNAILKLPDDQLLYLLSVFRNEPTPRIDITQPQWRHLISTLDSHMILPVFYEKLRLLPIDMRPPCEVMDALRSAYMSSDLKSAMRSRQLTSVLVAFNKRGIRSILLKGSALSLYLYDRPASRPCLDIDLLVMPQDALAAREILENMGYKCMENRVDVSEAGYCEEVFFPRLPGIGHHMVEIHWNLFSFSLLSQKIDIRQLFSRARKVEWNGMTVEVLDPIDSLLHAAAHLIYHHSQSIRLNWVYDIYLLCNMLKEPSEWEILLARSVECGARLALEESIKMAQCWTGLQIPPGFSDFSKWPSPDDHEIIAFSHAMDGRTVNLFRMVLPQNASACEKIKLIFRLIFPAPEQMHNFYPRSRGKPLYQAYLIRWWQLLKKL